MFYETDALWGLPDPDTQADFYADVPAKRALAWVVDSLLILATVVLIGLLTVFVGFFFFGFLLLAIGLIYRTVSLANRSATPGMRLAAIELRNRKGERLDLITAFLHTLIFTLSVSFVVPQLISIVLMLTTPRGQSLGDMLLGTAAVNRAARG